jgi:hypothetical protein
VSAAVDAPGVSALAVVLLDAAACPFVASAARASPCDEAVVSPEAEAVPEADAVCEEEFIGR